MELLDRIDRAVDGLCPCGAEPRTGSAYCSDDCVPTHRGRHTTSDEDGTAMRWRPDLVTEVDDSNLIDLGSVTWYNGRFNARLYQRGIPEHAEDLVWHLRLDDGHRYVGLDLHNIGDILDADHEARMAEAWQRLERELTDSRRLDPDPTPWGDVGVACPCGCGTFAALVGFTPQLLDALTARYEERLQDLYFPGGDSAARLNDTVFRAPDRLGDMIEDTRGEDAVSIWLDNIPATFDRDALSLPEGSLLDGLVAAQTEARLRERARQVGEQSRPEWADVMRRYGRLVDNLMLGTADGTVQQGQAVTVRPGSRVAALTPTIAALPASEARPISVGPALAELMRGFRNPADTALPVLRRMQQYFVDVEVATPEPEPHPMLAEIERRRNLVHGPQRPSRPPRYLGR